MKEVLANLCSAGSSAIRLSCAFMCFRGCANFSPCPTTVHYRALTLHYAFALALGRRYFIACSRRLCRGERSLSRVLVLCLPTFLCRISGSPTQPGPGGV